MSDDPELDWLAKVAELAIESVQNEAKDKYIATLLDYKELRMDQDRQWWYWSPETGWMDTP